MQLLDLTKQYKALTELQYHALEMSNYFCLNITLDLKAGVFRHSLCISYHPLWVI